MKGVIFFTPRLRSTFVDKYAMSVTGKVRDPVTVHFIGGVGNCDVKLSQLIKNRNGRRGWLVAKLNLNFLFSFLIHESPHVLSNCQIVNQLSA